MVTTSPLQMIRRLVEQGQYDAALAMCDGALSDGNFNHEIVREKVSILGKIERISEVIIELEALAAVSGEPADYFDLAKNYIKQKDYLAAITTIDKLLMISESEKFDYYVSSAKFFRAFAMIKLGRNREAAKDIQMLDDDMRLWMPGDGLVTLEQLKAAAK